MSEPLPRGVYPALLTFFDAGEEVDLEATAAHARRLVDAGVHGLVACGSTGEFHLLRPDERRAVLEAVVDAAEGRVPVLAHVGAPAVRDVLALAKHAAASGAAAVMAVTPYYNRVDRQGHEALLRAIHDVVPGLPLLAYTMPSMAGDRFEVGLVHALAAEGVVHGVKESGEELARLQAMIAGAPPSFAAFTGAAPLLAPALLSGARGAILAIANVAPELCVEVVEAAAEDGSRAMRLNASLAPLVAALAAAGPMPAGLRAAAGLRFGAPEHARRPLRAADAAARPAIAAALGSLAGRTAVV